MSKQQSERYKQRASEYVAAHEALPQQETKLPSGRNFVRIQSRMEPALQTALRSNPESVRKFFESFPFISPDNQRASIRFINTVKDKAVRMSLREYVRFALRFGVRYILESEVPFFRNEPVGLSGTKFWGKFENGLLLPGSECFGVPTDLADFQHEGLKLPEGVESILKSGKARWFVIDDHAGDSHLSDIENVAYNADSIAFVIHYNRYQPFLFCLIGENVSDNDWKKAARIKTRFQREQCQLGTRGRAPNLEEKRKQYAALQTGQPMKNVAIDLVGNAATEKQVSSKERALRRSKAELKRRP